MRMDVRNVLLVAIAGYQQRYYPQPPLSLTPTSSQPRK